MVNAVQSAQPRLEFDYIIVGAGAAGAIIASRLTEDPSITVCLIEAGGLDHNPYIHIPGGFIKTLFDPAYTWQFQTEPGDHIRGRRIQISQGRTLGGTSAINGMVYNRGQPADFDAWCQSGNAGWSYAEVLPYFQRTERAVALGDDSWRGRKGPVTVTATDWHHPLCDAFVAGAGSLGIPEAVDYNGPNQEGAGYFQRTIDRGWRVSTARAYLKPARRRSNLNIIMHAQVSRILFEGPRAIGVAYIRKGEPGVPRKVGARREVIVSAGTINTPRLLQISGVGSIQTLTDIGVPVVHELPGVGENFRDHYSIRFVARVKDQVTMNQTARGFGLCIEIARWLLGRPSILAISPSVAHVFWKSDESLSAPDLQCFLTPGSYKGGVFGLLDDFPGLTSGVYQHRPESTGFVRARSSDPFEKPAVQPNYLADPIDQQVLVRGMQLVRRLFSTPQMARFIDEEITPGPGVRTEDEMLDFARSNGLTSYHLIGTSRMGPSNDPTSVVDHELRVHGLSGLRVADASIMPRMPSGNTYASTMMIAEKAADMILGRKAPEPVKLEGI